MTSTISPVRGLTFSTVVRGYAILTCISAAVGLAVILVGLVWQSFEVGFVGTVVLALSSISAVRWMELAEREQARRAALASEQPR